jgi:phosphatidylglycerophosphatase C
MSKSDEPAAERPLAVFDLDGTLTRRDTFLPFLISYGWRHGRWLALLSLPFWVGLYACRLLSDRAAKQRVLIAFLRGQSRAKIARHAEWFCRSWVGGRLREDVVERLRAHQQAGDRVILLSASPEVYVPAIGRMLAINEVLCTRVVGSDERWDGALLGSNCKGEAKVQHLVEHLATSRPPSGSWAYGDSSSDLPLLRWVENGVLVKRGRLIPISAEPCRHEAHAWRVESVNRITVVSS